MTQPQTASPIERVLRDACARALAPVLSLTLTLTWYRSVAGLSRSLRDMHADDGLPRGFPPDLIALLRAVHTQACELALDPSLPPNMVAGLHRHIAALARAEHLAHPLPVKQKPAVKTTAKPAPPPPISPRAEKLLSGVTLPAMAPAWMSPPPKGPMTVLHRT